MAVVLVAAGTGGGGCGSDGAGSIGGNLVVGLWGDWVVGVAEFR